MKKFFLISLLIFVFLIMFFSKCNSETFSNLGNNQILWDGKMTTPNTVINNLKKEWANCGFNGFDLKPNDLSIINSKKRLIELLPSTNMIGQLDYEKIKCFVNKYDPENYVVISKTITNVPKILKPRNIIIVNNMLYQSTPFGVLKYQVSRLSNLNKNSSLNASIESSIINQHNIFNSSNHPVYIINGKLLQKRNNKIFDLQNNDEYIFKNINNKIELVNKKQSNRRSLMKISKPRLPFRRPSPSFPIRRPSPRLPIRRPSPKNLANLSWFKKNKTRERMSDVSEQYNLEEMSDVEDYNLEEMSDVSEQYNLEEMSDVEDYNLEEMSDVEDYNLEEMSDVEDYNLEEMSDVEDYNLEEMSNNMMGLNNFLPIVKILPGQKLEDIKKAAKALADKRLVQTTIMKAKEQATIDIKNAIDRLKINPNDLIAKKAVVDANKKLADIRKAASQIIRKGSNTIKNDLIKAKMEVKNALNKLKNNPNDPMLKKILEDSNKKLAEIRKEASEIFKKGSNAVKNNLRFATIEAKIARDYLRNNPNDAKAKKAVEDANKKLTDIRKAASQIIRKGSNAVKNNLRLAMIKAKKARDYLRNNPNDAKAKKAVGDANKKLADIRKAASQIIRKGSNAVKNNLRLAMIEAKKARDYLRNNPNDAKAKKAVRDANKKLTDIRKAASQIIRNAVKNNLRLATIKAKKARDYLRNNPNDAKAKKAVKDANKKLAEIRKKSTEMAKKARENAAKLLVQNTMIKKLQKAEREAKIAMNFLNKNPKDPRAKKLADEANKKYQQAKKSTNRLINKLVNSKSISIQQKNELSIKISEIDLNKLLDNLVSVMDYDGVVYICQSDSVRPLSNWATKLNEMMNKNKLTLLTVIPHFYYLDNKFNYVLIFVFNDDFCVILNKENLSQIMDVKSVLGISFSQNIPDKINCDDLKVILEQMTRGNVISVNKSKSLLKRYKC